MIVLGILVVIAGTFFELGLDRFMTLDEIQTRHSQLLALFERRPFVVIAAFMTVQIVALTLALPGAVLSFSLVGGAIFGPAWGTLIVLSSITIGDSAGFLVARYLLQDWVRRTWPDLAGSVDRGVERDGAFYLLALRLMAVIPFFLVNVTMALTRMKLRVFAPVSFVGLAPATALYVGAGTSLIELQSASDILSPRLIAILAALGLLPLIARLAFRTKGLG